MIRLLAFPLAARVYWRTGMLAQMGQYVLPLRVIAHLPFSLRMV
jgi:cytochrome c oxidase assembly factor CtaG